MPYDVEKNFEYHPAKGSQPAAYAALRAKGKELAVLMGELVPESRELSLARTKLEEAIMWANAGIARAD